MSKWTKKQANSWYENRGWVVGCNFLPSSAINQLEMFQNDTFDIETIKKERNIKLTKENNFKKN